MIAYLILAHNTPNHLRRLIRALDSPLALFFIHVDRKAVLSRFQDGLSQPNIVWLENRVASYWGEFSLVAAVTALLREALNRSPRSVRYLCLLSGSDYPVRSPEYIERFFSQHRGREFMNLVRIPCAAAGKLLDRVEQFRIQTPWQGFFTVRLVATMNHLLNDRVKFTRDYSKALGGLLPYGGSMWWALTREACEYTVSFIDERPDVVRFFRHSYIPDESFFHTIIGNSRFRSQVARNLTFADWSRPGGGPAVIDEDHLRGFAAVEPVMGDDVYGRGELLFARKFPDDSAQLTEWIDAHIIGRAESRNALRGSRRDVDMKARA